MSISALLNAQSGNATMAVNAQKPKSGEPSSLFASLMASFSAPAEVPKAESAGTVSESSRLESQLALAQSLSEQAAAGGITLADLQTKAEAALQNWQQQLTSRLEEKGIKLDEPLRLFVRPGDNQIVVQGDHPRKAEIEALLNEDKELANSLRGVSSMFDLLRCAEEHEEFARAYQTDPLAAVQNFGRLFQEETNWPLEFRLDEYGGELVS